MQKRWKKEALRKRKYKSNIVYIAMAEEKISIETVKSMSSNT